METRRKLAAKVAVIERQQRECDTDSDTESVATQMAFEDDGDYDSEYDDAASLRQEKVGQTTSRKRLNSSQVKQLVTRQPTRRPDPNVSNRNALMARENRKRKKEQLEQLEHENGNLQRDLKKLQKVVDRQEVMIRGLRNERNYLKSVLENQSDIVTLLKRLQPDQPEELHHQTPKVESGASPASSTTQSIYSDSGMSLGGDNSPFYDGNYHNNNNNTNQINDGDDFTSAHFDSSAFDNGTTEFDLFDESLLLNADFPLISTDLMFSANPFESIGGGGCGVDPDDDDDLFNFDLTSSPSSSADQEQQVNGNLRSETIIRSEHNYVERPLISHTNDQNNNNNTDGECEEGCPVPAKRSRHGPGICLHIGGGKVSIEFCAQCHESATRDWQVKRL